MTKKLISHDIEIEIVRARYHAKASERYVDVIVKYGVRTLDWSIPIEYRRTGTDLTEATEQELEEYIVQACAACEPENWDKWIELQSEFWRNKPNAATTKSFFDALVQSGFGWCSVDSELPANPNWARRIQDIKELGYTLATDTAKIDEKTGKRATHILLLPLPRGGISGYETWSAALRERIIKRLGIYDAFEAKAGRKDALLPDHKFPEIRWDATTRRDTLEDLTDEEIGRDFQLLTNQRNQQKREVCRRCYQENKRGYPFGVKYFYEGNEQWPEAVPKSGSRAEAGCVGCGWYDLEKWRQSIITKLAGE